MKTTTTATMLMMLMMMVMMTGLVDAGRRGGRWHNQRPRRCNRAADQGILTDGPGSRFVWSMMGLDEDDLRVTYQVGAFAPEGASVVFMYPRDRRQRDIGLVPARLFYDFSNPDEKVIVVRQARRGKGMCLVMRYSDVDSYDDLLTQLEERNVTNREVVGEEDAIRLVVEESSDPSEFSEVLRDLCSQDLCGNPVDPLYFVASVEDLSEEEEELIEEAVDQDDAILDRSFMLVNDRVIVSGLPTRRQLRRQARMEERDQRRQGRREQKRQERLERRERRRQERGRERRNRRARVQGLE